MVASSFESGCAPFIVWWIEPSPGVAGLLGALRLLDLGRELERWPSQVEVEVELERPSVAWRQLEATPRSFLMRF